MARGGQGQTCRALSGHPTVISAKPRIDVGRQEGCLCDRTSCASGLTRYLWPAFTPSQRRVLARSASRRASEPGTGEVPIRHLPDLALAAASDDPAPLSSISTHRPPGRDGVISHRRIGRCGVALSEISRDGDVRRFAVEEGNPAARGKLSISAPSFSTADPTRSRSRRLVDRKPSLSWTSTRASTARRIRQSGSGRRLDAAHRISSGSPGLPGTFFIEC